MSATISFILFAIIGLVFTLLGMFFVIRIGSSVKAGLSVRQQLAARIESLRMSKMLKALGLDSNQYLFGIHLATINNSMNNCEKCDSSEICDKKLQQKSIKPEDIDFCPNQACLTQYHQLKNCAS